MASIAAQQRSLFEPDFMAGIDGTFEEAKHQPVHGWYAYLEGYSSAFVESLRLRYLPNARRIIDPFAGTGTSPIALGYKGVACGYCEVNPVMADVIQTKVAALELSRARKELIAHRLLEVSSALAHRLRVSEAAEDLRSSYERCFGLSRFFTNEAFEEMLKLRSICDEELTKDTLTGRLISLAVIANIVQCSLLKRAGDVRYKTASELKRGLPSATSSVAQHLARIAADLKHAPALEVSPTLLAMDAKTLHDVPAFEADGVITSPPYLNGTNYIRNTKLELWFLRRIRNSEDLRKLRDSVVTSGICDVIAGKARNNVHPILTPLIRDLSRNAYDKRIPKMVAAYFNEMHEVLVGLWHQTKTGSLLCIDIGDSRYGAVNVPTPDILATIAESVGFRLIEKRRLRERFSKDRSKLRQDVLILERTNGELVRSSCNSTVSKRQQRWKWFSQSVPHQQSPYNARNWGHPLHSACSYQGKMKPSLAYFLVHCFSAPGEVVLDPFSGAGTIPFEAALQGRQAFGFDISLLACVVSRAKLSVPNSEALRGLVLQLGEFVERHQPRREDYEAAAKISFNRAIPEYFHQSTLKEILAARRFLLDFRNESSEWAFVMTAVLHILHGNRPYALSRRSHPVTPFAPTGPVEYRALIPRLKAKLNRMLEAPRPPEFREGKVYMMDLLDEWPKHCRMVDTIITSPPFFDSTRFYMTNWMRYWFCGWERGDFEEQPKRFVESLQRSSLSVYKKIFQRFRENLKPNGSVVLHLGQSRKCDMASELVKISRDFFTVDAVFSEDVTHCEKHGLSDKGTVTAHQYVVLRPD